MALKTILCLFMIDFRPPQILKNIGPAEAFEYFHICILIPLETDFGSILDTKIAPKSVPRGSRMALEIMVVFEGLQDPLKSIFQPTWPQHVPNLAPNMPPSLGPKWCRNRSRRPMGPHGPPWNPSEPSLDRFWVDFWLFFVACWVHMSATIWYTFGYSCGIST